MEKLRQLTNNDENEKNLFESELHELFGVSEFFLKESKELNVEILKPTKNRENCIRCRRMTRIKNPLESIDALNLCGRCLSVVFNLENKKESHKQSIVC